MRIASALVARESLCAGHKELHKSSFSLSVPLIQALAYSHLPRLSMFLDLSLAGK